MRRVMLGLAMAAATITMPLLAKAADLGPRQTPAPADKFLAPVYSWTGFYMGAQGGYSWGDSSGTQNAGGTFFPVVPYTVHPQGFIGGGHLGFNYQTGLIVLGIEGDIEAAAIEGISSFSASGQDNVFDVKADALASVRGRIGFAHDRYLIYGTGGVAWGHVITAFDDTLNGWRTGWTAGAGIEYALFNNWSANLEYRFTDLGRVSHFDPALNSVTDNTFSLNAIRVGLSRKFGGS
jgi:outer membrane immunogenic protein